MRDLGGTDVRESPPASFFFSRDWIAEDMDRPRYVGW